MPQSPSYKYWRGGRFNNASIVSLLEVERRFGPLRVMQGGYNRGGVAASAGTHDGGGVVDLSVSGLTNAQRRDMLVWLRRCGWAAWLRTPAQGFVYHVHAVRIGDKSASWGAQAQVVSYKNGRNGLARNGYDDGPSVSVVTWEKSKYNPANAPKPKPSKKPTDLVIGGKRYPGLNSISVHWINESRKHKSFSRHTFILQSWLSEKEIRLYPSNKRDGRWGPVTQKALDDYRRKFMKLSGSAATGGIGIGSLTSIRNRAGSKRKLRTGK